MPAGAAVAIRPQYPHTHARQRLFACTACGFPVDGDRHDCPVHPAEALQQPLGICRSGGAAAHSVCLLPVCRRDAAADPVRRARPCRAASRFWPGCIWWRCSAHHAFPIVSSARSCTAPAARSARSARCSSVQAVPACSCCGNSKRAKIPRTTWCASSTTTATSSASTFATSKSPERGTTLSHWHSPAASKRSCWPFRRQPCANGEIFCSFAKRQAAA